MKTKINNDANNKIPNVSYFNKILKSIILTITLILITLNCRYD